MLNAVHKQLQASHLADLLASSPLVLVYQLIGNVKSHQVASSMQKQLDATCPDGEVQATCIKVKNTLGMFTPGVDFASYLKADNILVGWKVPSHGLLHQIQASRTTGIVDILAASQQGLTAPQQHSTEAHSTQPSATSQQHKPGAGSNSQQPPATGQQQAPAQGSGISKTQGAGNRAAHRNTGSSLSRAPNIPHSVMVAAIQQSLELPKRLPVALLASFYKGQPIRLKDLQLWQGLDEATVISDLLSELDAIGSNLLQLEGVHDTLVGTLTAAAPMDELLFMLDNRAEPSSAEEKGAAAAVTGA